ncbi:MAG: GGDEF domain-containing phosphodiesterase [Anaerovoracaceae bacterium]|nr:GGDEF domain-containing phosphodiesterase [Bacillota bacterium]MDY2671237.1 GGDEF domain-containing phosphodiesterase [Anaerovoracaceae bacterium]
MKKYGVMNEEESLELLNSIDASRLAEYNGILNHAAAESAREADPGKAIDIYLRTVGEAMGAAHTMTFRQNNDGTFSMTHVWDAEGQPSWNGFFQNMPECEIDYEWFDAFRNNQAYMITDMDELREYNPAACELPVSYGIERLCLCPLFSGTRVAGFFEIVNPAEEHMAGCCALSWTSAGYLSLLLRQELDSRNDFDSELVHTDSVTGLYSGNIFRKSLGLFLEGLNNGQYGGEWDLIYFNILRFKMLNDRHGYVEGDRILKRMGNAIRKAIRSEYVTRLDDDRFYALVEDSRAEQAVRKVHKTMLEDETDSINISAGICRIEKGVTDTAQVMDRARIAGDSPYIDYTHYYRSYSSEMSDMLRKESYIIDKVDEAIKKGWIKVYYQPVISTLSRKVASAEALSRWQDPEYGMLSPADFIPVLEEARLLYKVDMFVLEKVCTDIRSAADARHDYCRVSINLSRHDLELSDLHARINSILDKYSIPHDVIHFEITESALIRNESIVRDHIERFHQDGFDVWLDDFGSGYSSLNTLHKYNFDCIKIDMMFFRMSNERTPLIISSIVNMSKEIRMTVLCEGVETREQLNFLKSIGCTYAQGFLFSKPVPIEELFANDKIKSMGMETRDDHIFYSNVSKMNILRFTGFTGGIGQTDSSGIRDKEIPVAILETFGERYRIIYENDTIMKYADVIKGGAFNKEGYIDEIESSQDSAAISRQIMERTERDHKPVEYDFITDSIFLRIICEFITKYKDRRAFLIRGINMSSYGSVSSFVAPDQEITEYSTPDDFFRRLTLTYKRLKSDPCYSPEAVYDWNYDENTVLALMRQLNTLFDCVRIIDPITCGAAAIGEGCEEFDYPSKCYSIRGFSEKCEDCTEYQILKEKNRVEIFDEYRSQKRQILNRYIKVNGHSYVLQYVRNIRMEGWEQLGK